MDEIDHAVFQVNAGQAENEGRNRIEKGAGAIGKAALRSYSMIDRFENLVVGFETRSIFGLTTFIEFTNIHMWYIHVLAWVRDFFSTNPIPYQ
jgi:hypothetical protein